MWLVSADNSEYVWTSSSASGTASDWEKLGVVVDLSGYAPLASPEFTGTPTAPTPSTDDDSTKLATTAYVKNVVAGITCLVKTATGTISTSATSATVNFTGTLIGAFAVMSGSMVIVDVAPSASSVTFSVAAAPSAAVTCTVVYI